MTNIFHQMVSRNRKEEEQELPRVCNEDDGLF